MNIKTELPRVSVLLPRRRTGPMMIEESITIIQRYWLSFLLLLGAIVLLGIWARIPPIGDVELKRFGHFSLLVDKTDVLVLGGSYVSNGRLAVHDWCLFDFNDSNEVLLKEPRDVAISDAIMIGGRVYIYYQDDQLRSFSIDDHELNEISRASTSIRRGACQLVKLDGGRFMAISGSWHSYDADSVCEVYDIGADTWCPIAPLNQARYGEGVVQLKDGSVMVIGGRTTNPGGLSSSKLLRSCEVFNLTSGKWTYTGDLSIVRDQCNPILLDGGDVLVTSAGSDFFERYNSATGVWKPVDNMNVLRSRPKLIKLKDGTVLASCGEASDHIVATCEIYDPHSEKWTVTGSMHVPRDGFTQTLLPDGKVLAIGGGTDTTPDEKPVGSAEIYDPVLGTWKVVEGGQGR